MKKMISVLLCVALLFTSIGNSLAADTNETGAVYSDATYGGFDLSWTNNGERDILLSAANEKGMITFQYDTRELRTSKTNAEGDTTYFTYDDSRNLIAVQSENARNPKTDSTQWKTAVLYACYLMCAETTMLDDQTAALAAVMARPYGITSNHTYFCSFDSAKTKLQEGTTLRLAVIAGYSLIGSTAESLESIYLAYDEEFYEENGYHIARTVDGVRYECVNIFYCD